MSDLRSSIKKSFSITAKRPRNFHPIEDADHHANGYNPLCGDKVTIYLTLVDDRITDISFQGSGCAISTASASILTETLKGKTRKEAEAIFEVFHSLVTGQPDEIRRRARPRQAGGFFRRLRISRARQVRLACLAHAEERARGQPGGRQHGSRLPIDDWRLKTMADCDFVRRFDWHCRCSVFNRQSTIDNLEEINA